MKKQRVQNNTTNNKNSAFRKQSKTFGITFANQLKLFLGKKMCEANMRSDAFMPFYCYKFYPFFRYFVAFETSTKRMNNFFLIFFKWMIID